MTRPTTEQSILLFERGLTEEELDLLVKSYTGEFPLWDFVRCGSEDLIGGRTSDELRKAWLAAKDLRLYCKLKSKSLVETVEELLAEAEVEADMCGE